MTSAIIVNLITNRKENLFKDYDLEEVINLSKTLNIACKHTENIKLNRELHKILKIFQLIQSIMLKIFLTFNYFFHIRKEKKNSRY